MTLVVPSLCMAQQRVHRVPRNARRALPLHETAAGAQASLCMGQLRVYRVPRDTRRALPLHGRARVIQNTLSYSQRKSIACRPTRHGYHYRY